MLTTTIAKATAPHLPWAATEPGLLAILVQALGRRGAKPGKSRFAKPQPVPFAWL